MGIEKGGEGECSGRWNGRRKKCGIEREQGREENRGMIADGGGVVERREGKNGD